MKSGVLTSGAVIPAIGVIACATSRRVVASLSANCREVQPGCAFEMMRDNTRLLVLDVRHLREFTEELPHIFRARELPLSELPRRYLEVSVWKKETVVIFSRDGTDAASACEFLSRQGFEYVSHVAGGVAEWQGRKSGRTDGSVQ